MIAIRDLSHGLVCSFRDRACLQLQIMALRHQLEALNRQKRGRLRLSPIDRAFWSLLYRFWSGSRDVLVIVKPDTVMRWQRMGFRLYWDLEVMAAQARSPGDLGRGESVDPPHVPGEPFVGRPSHPW